MGQMKEGQSMGAWNKTKEQLILLFISLMYALVLIVNNGNILTDGTDERRYLQRKYNGL